MILICKFSDKKKNPRMAAKFIKILLIHRLTKKFTFFFLTSSSSSFNKVITLNQPKNFYFFRALNELQKFKAQFFAGNLKLASITSRLPRAFLSNIRTIRLKPCFIFSKNFLSLFSISDTGKLSTVYTGINNFCFQKETRNKENGSDSGLKKDKKALPFWNQCFDKNRLKNFVLWFLVTYGEYRTVELIEQFKNIGFEYATKAGISLGIDDLKIPPKKSFLILEAEKITNSALHQYNRGEITGVERFQKMIDTWHRTSEVLKQEVIENFELTDTLNPVYMMAFSGARGNISQVRQLVGMRGLMANPQGQILDFPIRSNFREGLSLTEYIISTYGARKGIVDTALRTANAGYLTRRLVDVAQHIIVSNFDCGTFKGIFLNDMKEGTKVLYSLQNRLVGRVLGKTLFSRPSINKKEQLNLSSSKLGLKAASSSKIAPTPSLSLTSTLTRQKLFLEGAFFETNPKSIKEQTLPTSGKKLSFNQNIPLKTLENSVAPVYLRNTEISVTLAIELSQLSKGAPSPKIFVRSSLTCETQKSVCQLCYGWSLAQGNLVSIGEAVGVVAAQSVGEPGTQLTMRTFHTGGVFTGDITDQIKALYNGFVKYLEPIAGTLIRTPEGKIAFLTKAEGFIEVISYLTPRLVKHHSVTTQKFPQEIFNSKETAPLVLKRRKDTLIQTFRLLSKKNSFYDRRGELSKHIFSKKKKNDKRCLFKKHYFLTEAASFKDGPLSLFVTGRFPNLLHGKPLLFLRGGHSQSRIKLFVKNLQKQTEFLQNNKNEQEKRKIYKIPAYTLLFVRHGENIVEKQVIAQISNISFLAPIVREAPAEQSKTGSDKSHRENTSQSFLKGQQNKRDDAEFTINSEMEGEFYSVKLNLLEKHIGPLGRSSVVGFTINKSPLQRILGSRGKFVLKDRMGGPLEARSNLEGEAEAILEACDWGYAWILSGKVYQLPIMSEFFPQPGDFVNRKSLMNQIQLKTTEKGGKFGFVESKFNSNLLLNKPVLFLEINKTIFKKIGYLFTLPQSNFLNSEILESVLNKKALGTALLPLLNYRSVEANEKQFFLSSNDIIFTPNSFLSLSSFPYSKGLKPFSVKTKAKNSFMSVKNSQINKSHLLFSEKHFTHNQLQNSSANWSHNLNLFLEWFPHSTIRTGGFFISDNRTLQGLMYTSSMWPTTITSFNVAFKYNAYLLKKSSHSNKIPVVLFPLVLNEAQKKSFALLFVKKPSFEGISHLLPLVKKIKIEKEHQFNKMRINSKESFYSFEVPTCYKKKIVLVKKQVTLSPRFKKEKNLASILLDPIIRKRKQWLSLLQIKQCKLLNDITKKPYYDYMKLTTQRNSLYKDQSSDIIWVAKHHLEIPRQRFRIESKQSLFQYAPLKKATQIVQFPIPNNRENNLKFTSANVNFTSSFFADAFGVRSFIFRTNRQGIKEPLTFAISGSFQITKKILFKKPKTSKLRREVISLSLPQKDFKNKKDLVPEPLSLFKIPSKKKNSVSYFLPKNKKILGEKSRQKSSWSKTFYKKNYLKKLSTREYWNRLKRIKRKLPPTSSLRSSKTIERFQKIFITKNPVENHNISYQVAQATTTMINGVPQVGKVREIVNLTLKTFNNSLSNKSLSIVLNKPLFLLFTKRITALYYQMAIRKAYFQTNKKLKEPLGTSLSNPLFLFYYYSYQFELKASKILGRLSNGSRPFSKTITGEKSLLQTTALLFKNYSAGFNASRFRFFKITFNTRIAVYPHHLNKIKEKALLLRLRRLGGILVNCSDITLKSPLKKIIKSRFMLLPFSLEKLKPANFLYWANNSNKRVGFGKTNLGFPNSWVYPIKSYFHSFKFGQTQLPLSFFGDKEKFNFQKAFSFFYFFSLKEDFKRVLEPLYTSALKKKGFNRIQKDLLTHNQVSQATKLSLLNTNIVLTVKKGWLYFPFYKADINGSILKTSICNSTKTGLFLNQEIKSVQMDKRRAFNFKAVKNHKSLINPGDFVIRGLLFDINKIYMEWFLLKNLKVVKGLMTKQIDLENNNFLEMKFSNNLRTTLTSGTRKSSIFLLKQLITTKKDVFDVQKPPTFNKWTRLETSTFNPKNSYLKGSSLEVTPVIGKEGLSTTPIALKLSKTQASCETTNHFSWVINKNCRFLSHPMSLNIKPSFLLAPSVILIQKALEIRIPLVVDYKIEIAEIYKNSADSIVTESKLFLVSGLVGKGLNKVKFPNKYNTDLTLILITILYSTAKLNTTNRTSIKKSYHSKINLITLDSQKPDPDPSQKLGPLIGHLFQNTFLEPKLFRGRILSATPHFKQNTSHQSYREEFTKNLFKSEKIKSVKPLQSQKISFFSKKIYVWKSIKNHYQNNVILNKPHMKNRIQLHQNKSYNSLLIQQQLRCSNLNKQKKSIQPFIIHWPTSNVDFKVKKGSLSFYKMAFLGSQYSNLTSPPQVSRFCFLQKVEKLLRTTCFKKKQLLTSLQKFGNTKKKVLTKTSDTHQPTLKTILFKKPINISPLLIGCNIPYGSDFDFHIPNVHLNAKLHPPGLHKRTGIKTKWVHNSKFPTENFDYKTVLSPKMVLSQRKAKSEKLTTQWLRLFNVIRQYGISNRKLAFSFAQPCFSFFLSKKLGVRSTFQQPLKSYFIPLLVAGKLLKPKLPLKRGLLFSVTPSTNRMKQQKNFSLQNPVFPLVASLKKPFKENKKVFMTLDTNGSSLYDNKFVSSNPFIKSSYLSSFVGEFIKAIPFVAPSFVEAQNQETASTLFLNPNRKNDKKEENPTSTFVALSFKKQSVNKSGVVKQTGGGCIILTKPNLICFTFERVTPLRLKHRRLTRRFVKLCTIPMDWVMEKGKSTASLLEKKQTSQKSKAFFSPEIKISNGRFFVRSAGVLLLKTFSFNKNYNSLKTFLMSKANKSLSLKTLFFHSLKNRINLWWRQRSFLSFTSLKIKNEFGNQKTPFQPDSFQGTFKGARENLSKEMSNFCKRSLQTIIIHPLDSAKAGMENSLLTFPTGLLNNIIPSNSPYPEELKALQTERPLTPEPSSETQGLERVLIAPFFDTIFPKDLDTNKIPISTISDEAAQRNLEFLEKTISPPFLPLHLPSISNGNNFLEGRQKVSYPASIPLLNLISSSNSILFKNTGFQDQLQTFVNFSFNRELTESKEVFFRMPLQKQNEGDEVPFFQKQHPLFTPIFNIKGLVTGFNKGHNQSLFTNKLSLGEFFVYGDKILPPPLLKLLKQELTTKTLGDKEFRLKGSIKNKAYSLKSSFGDNFFNSMYSSQKKAIKLDNNLGSKERIMGPILNKTLNIKFQPEGIAVPTSGQIIHIGRNKITLRRAQPIFISPKSILHVSDGSFVLNNDPVMTLTYQRLKTGDIVQGIPKVEQYLEARITKQGRLFRDCLPNLLKGLFKRYRSQLPLERAVRQSFYKIQQIIVDGVLRVYRSQGVTIADKHLEVIVKQMTSKVKIINGAQTGFFPGEVIDLNFVERVNLSLMKKIQYEPLILGITRAALEVDSFLSAASFQQTTRVLSSAAIEKRKDFLKGLKENILLGNLMPAGTGYLVYLDEISL